MSRVTRSNAPRWRADELEAIASTPWERLEHVAARYHRALATIEAKREELDEARRARRQCPAFLPDDGVPFSARMHRILNRP